MLSGRTKIIFITLLLLANWLLRTKTTSADIFAERLIRSSISATTLSFSERHTANNSEISSLFNTVGMQPDGFDIKAVRIKNDGKLNSKYHLKAQKTGGEENACRNLTLQVLLKGEEKYKGTLLNLSLDSNLANNNPDDWIFLISLDNNDSLLKNKNCEFNIFFNTFRNQPNEKPTGFHAEKSLTNLINNGIW